MGCFELGDEHTVRKHKCVLDKILRFYVFSGRGTYNYHCFVTKTLHFSHCLSYSNARKIESPNYSNMMEQVQGVKFRLG